MMSLLKKVLTAILNGVIWVFILSVSVDNKRLFDHAHDIIVDNPVVAFADQQLASTWELVQEGWSATIGSGSSKDKLLKL